MCKRIFWSRCRHHPLTNHPTIHLSSRGRRVNFENIRSCQVVSTKLSPHFVFTTGVSLMLTILASNQAKNRRCQRLQKPGRQVAVLYDRDELDTRKYIGFFRDTLQLFMHSFIHSFKSVPRVFAASTFPHAWRLCVHPSKLHQSFYHHRHLLLLRPPTDKSP
jgi:hypothetical protein